MLKFYCVTALILWTTSEMSCMIIITLLYRPYSNSNRSVNSKKDKKQAKIT